MQTISRILPITRGYHQLSRYQQQLSPVEKLISARAIVQAKLDFANRVRSDRSSLLIKFLGIIGYSPMIWMTTVAAIPIKFSLPPPPPDRGATGDRLFN